MPSEPLSRHLKSARAWVSMRYYRTKHALVNAGRDLWDRHARGYCCAAPSGLPDSPGYHFWRCNLKRDHQGAHRHLNYLWVDPAAEKEPVTRETFSAYSPRENIGPRLDRYPCRTRRQKRQVDAWHEMLDREREANYAAERRDQVDA